MFRIQPYPWLPRLKLYSQLLPLRALVFADMEIPYHSKEGSILEQRSRTFPRHHVSIILRAIGGIVLMVIGAFLL